MGANWEEGEMRVIKLPEDNPRMLAVYIDYTYTGQLNMMRNGKEDLATVNVQDFNTYVLEEYHD
jgi:hypothetical protein